MPAGPSQSLYDKMFGKKKRTEDINLPSKRQQKEADQKRVSEAIAKPREYKKEEKPTLLARANEAKKKYNPFDRFVSATKGK